MAKKEFFKKEDLKPESNFVYSPQGSNFSVRLFGVVKFVLGICLLPFVYAFSLSFFSEFSLVNLVYSQYFWSGVITFLISYLFIWEPQIIYSKGQKILESMFSFFKPLVKVAPSLVPVYLVILVLAYGLIRLVTLQQKGLEFFTFCFGFSIALHLVFSAKTLRGKQKDFLKASYIFGFSFVYLVNLLLLAFFFSLIFEPFSFIKFFNSSFQLSSDIFRAVFTQLFINK